MAHSGRWRFPARPGSGGWGRRGLGGCRVRVPALRSLRGESAEERATSGGGGGAAAAALAGSGGGGAGGPSSAAAPSSQPAAPLPASTGVAPGFDAALQVSAAIGINLRRFRAACGAEAGSGEDEQFLGFGSDDEAKGTNSPKSLAVSVKASARKPRGRPRNGSDRSPAALPESLPIYSLLSKPEPTSMEKIKRKEFKSGEKRRGRPPALTSVKFKISHKECIPDAQKGGKEEKEKVKKIKRAPSATFQHAAKIKKLRTGKLSPLKSQFKSGKLQIGRKGIQIARRRGRPPSSDRLKTMPALVCSQLEKVQRARKEREGVPSLPKDEKPTVRQSPRRPVRMIPSCKRTDATIAKQLLQKAKKGAQKKMEKEAAKLQGRKGRTQLKNIRQFIMPVVSAISSRIIKTPKRFIEDEDYDPPIKIGRLESTPNSRFSATSCESSEKSSVASQHSSQLSSDSSRSSSPSVDTSTDSQASEEMQALSEECIDTSEVHPSLPASTSPGNEGAEQRRRRRRRFSMAEKTFAPKAAKKVPSLQSVSQQQSSPSSSSPPPPLLTPPPPLQPAAGISDHAPWLMPPTIPLASPFLPSSSAAPVQEKRKSILREPTFRWTSLKPSRSEPQYFSSAKYAKEGLIRKPVFDNFRPPPLTPEDVGFAAAAASFTPPGATAPTHLFSPLHSGTRFDLHKRSPLLRAPRFTPSEAHSRIFESVTLPPSISRSAAGSATAAASSRKRKRRVFSPIRSESRSPSHSMRTRSGRLGTSELPTLPPASVSSSLTSISVGSLTTSALNATTFTFPSHSLSQTGEAAEKGQRPRKQTNLPAQPFSSGGTASLFPWFAPSPHTERTRSKDKATEELSKDKERDNSPEKEKSRERDRDREKENKRESRKEEEKKKKKKKASEIQSSSALFPPTRGSKGKVLVSEDVATSSFAKKPTGRRKLTAADPAAVVPAVVLVDSVSIKTKLPKKSRGGLEKSNLDLGLEASSAEKEEPLRLPAASVGIVKHSSISSVLAHADKLPMADKRVASLLKKAKAQLYKIEKSKSLKQVDQPKGQGQESDSSETSVRGPRIKHVCRRAAVALGRKRAVFPDDMPTLSALPWEEREKILSSMGNDDKSSVAGSEDAEPLAPPIKPIKPVTRSKAPQEPPVKKGRRSRRCGQCPGCQVPEDCGVCTNCLDKPKFGGRNIKKQCCKMRKCQNLQWMPSKAYLQKQAKAVKKKEKKSKSGEKKDSHVGKIQEESGQKAAASPLALGKEDQASKRSSEPARKASEEKIEEGQLLPPILDPKQPLPSATRKAGKQASPALSPIQLPSLVPPKKEAPKTVLAELKKKIAPSLEAAIEQNRQKKIIPRPSLPMKQKSKEKEKPLPVSKPENSPLNTLSTLSNNTPSKQKPLTDGVHRIRVDFKEDCEAESVWEMGGLGILTSIPITPRVVCFLCASSGNVEFVYCQVCCEPFHKFCLEVNERPLEDQLENWCCRRCKFCHVCGRPHQASKQLLECNKCRNSYHPECLGPNYPTKPTKKKKVWICTKCVRCKSCGATTPGKGWDAQWSHDFSLCHDCAKLFAKGNFCPLCDKCYDDDDYESKMMQCGKCDRWVHAKCENLSDEMYEILSNLPESVAYTCINCTEQHPPEWRLALEKELQLSLKQVLTALLNSRTTSHLLRYRQAAKPPDLNPEIEESVPSQSSPKGPDPPILTEVGKQEEQPPLDLEGVKRKMDHGGYPSVLEFSDDLVKIIQAAINADGGQPELKKANSVMKSFFMRQMERVFPWFNVKKSRFWEPNKVTANSGMLPNAVLPPSLDHNYAQWQEREENRCAQQQPSLMKKIIPAPKFKGPGEPNSPTPLHLPASPLSSSDRSQDDSPELSPPPDVEDNRQCCLCLKYGDDGGNDAGRLLYIGQNEWTHVNCALWSAEVFEEEDGSLKNVHVAVIRGKQLRCEFCQKSGATVGCCLATCTSNYHFMCSRAKNCVFLEDKKVYCSRHKDLIKGEIVPENGFEVLRRVFVDFEGISLRRKFLNGLEPENIHVMIGSMSIDCLGILNDLSDCEDRLFPVGYQCSRVYWSTTDARKRCVYTCKIMECRPPLLDSDINSTMEHDDNRTIVHNPVSLSAEIPPRDGHAASADLNPPSADLSPHPQNLKALRIRTLSFAPSQRTPGSRPLPSAGSPTPVTHEIVTVGDPLLSSGFRSIGSRRPSASLFPQPLRSWMLPPTGVGTTNAQRNTVSSGPSSSPVQEHTVSIKHTERSVGPAALHVTLQDTFTPPSLAIASRGKGAPPREGTLSFETVPSGGPFSAKSEKEKLLSLQDPSASCGNSKAGCHRQSISVPEGNLSKVEKFPDSSSGLFSPEESVVSALLHQKPPKKEQDRHLTQADKNCFYEAPEAKASPFSGISNQSPCINDPVSSVDRESRQKMKKGIKDRHSSKLFRSLSVLPISHKECAETEFVHRAMTSEHINQQYNSIAVEKLIDNNLLGQETSKDSFQSEMATSRDLQNSQKRTVKVTLTPLKMEGESQSKNIQREHDAESQPKVCTPASVSQSVSIPEHSGNDCSVPETQNSASSSMAPTDPPYPNLPVQDSGLMIQDGAKEQEEGSYKRRYPRRSARARSNMFFGLTPLYGVRSYGEEDLPFYSNSTGKKRGRRSAEGQVDGADDLSTSDEEDLYYYNFTRTVVSSSNEHMASHGLFREEEQISLPKISQLDGVDDGTESDASITVTTRKINSGNKRNGKENGTESLKLERSEDSGEKMQVTKSSVGHKTADPKMENCRVKTQDSLEAQLSSLEAVGRRPRVNPEPSEKNLLDTFSTELLKSDSDNNNSDDCGNILPSDIMDFVLKNTPSMQALGESPESSSSELLTLGEGLGLDSNRAKDMGLFEVFSQQLPTAEPVDSSVSSSISAEEQFELPLELPSDLSVLTTRSPAVPSQNHSRLAVIPEPSLATSGERSMLTIPSSNSAEKRVTVTEKASSGEAEPTLLSPRVAPSPDGPLTPDPFIQSHLEAEHMASPPCGPRDAGLGAGQELSGRSSGTPGLPVSPSLPLQNPKYGPSAPDKPGPSPISNAAVQTAPLHLKAAAEKLLVVNQNMQPLYVLQTLPNGITQKIQLTSPVSSGPAGMEAGASVLGPMDTASLALAAGLSPGLPSARPLFPAASKGLLNMPHQQQHLHSFSASSSGSGGSSFPATLGSSASGLLIGVQQPPDPEVSPRADIGPALTPPPTGLGKKRSVARLHSRRAKKLTPSAAAPSDLASMNFHRSSPPGLLDLGATCPRTAPRMIKRSKPGLMYFEQAPLLPQEGGIAVAEAALGASPSITGPKSGHLASPPSELNVAPLPSPGPTIPPHLLGQGGSDVPGISDMSSLSSLLIKATRQELSLTEQPASVPPVASSMFPSHKEVSLAQSASAGLATTALATGISVLPSLKTVGMSADPGSSYQAEPLTQLLACKAGPAPPHLDLPPSQATPLSDFPQLMDTVAVGRSRPAPCVPAASPGSSPSTVLGSTRAKVKRLPTPLGSKGSGKKPRVPPFWNSFPGQCAPPQGRRMAAQDPGRGSQPLRVQPEEATDILQPAHKSAGHLQPHPQLQPTPSTSNELEHADSSAEEESSFSSPLMFWLQQERTRKENLPEKRPKKGLIFEISSDDGFQICAESIEEAWKSLTDKVQEARSNARLKQLSFAGVSGLQMLGILHHAVVFLIEQLCGAKHCSNYKFRFHKPEEAKEPPVNPHGSARAEGHLRKSGLDMFNFLASKHRQPPQYNPNEEEEEEVQLKSARRATSMDLPMPMRFRHLRKTSKEAVGVYRSPIHGRGLFCKRNIDAGEMVIEYAGNVIRSILTDKREKYYDSKGIGCYMFRIDDSEVVDATMHGNAARFINHSCEPNCYSRVIHIDGQKHIVIFAMRKIYRGEELTYDYKFPIEDASNKLLCNCGAKKCRRFLN
ncbi:histone-lysine N-methyltransferase 2A isoform X3 [Crotalus tigris]|uniref:histone-lysine N-methyltransferase 2A isoform X3 n=1 Tax=Crotalus tigris TaxID=88082 RepID=UPI00192FB4E4|nr:histone-lysine N-methyltransferase 2A isoform X3 [Crotalus tigris]